MALTAQGAISVAIEQVAKDPQKLYEMQSSLDKLIQDNGRAQAVSPKLFRIAFKTAVSGAASYGNLDDPNTGFPDGGQPKYTNGNVAPVTTFFPITWTKLAEIVDKEPTAIVNTVADMLSDSMDRVKQFRDMALSAGDGTGVIGYITGVPVAGTISMDNTTFGAKLAVPGQIVSVFNGNALRGSFMVGAVNNQLGSGQTISVDPTASNTSAGVVVNALPANTQQGDILRVFGTVDGAPVGHAGIPAYMSNVPTGLKMNVDASVAANNWVLSNGYDLAQSQVTLPALRIPLAQIKQIQGPDAVKVGKLVINTAPAQVSAYEELGDALMMIPLAGGLAGGLDLMWRGTKSVDGHPINESNHAANNRWDFLSVKSWGKVRFGSESPFWFTWDGKKVFPKYANGNITAAATSYLVDTTNYYVDNTKNQASLYNAKVPAGY